MNPTGQNDSAADPSPNVSPQDASLPGDPLRSIHTSSFPELLAHLGASVWVTTYQARKLVVLRNDGGVLNTHFRTLSKPMGLARVGGRLAIGCGLDILEFHDVPAVCQKLDESDDYPSQHAQHDGCFLPRRSHCTGDVQIHEMAWIDRGASQAELVFVNTAFSCLSLRSEDNSFEPIWRPKFIKQLIPGDCCHLNGLATRGGKPAFVTAFGQKEAPGAWRENKRNGGLIIEVESQEIVTSGLSMPHSPRWYNDQLWVLESGDGSIGTIDLAEGKYRPVAQFPGFTRGLSFLGPFALIGLSQVRESAIFSGIPLVERLPDAEQRACGVWVLNVETGQTVGFCQFQQGVQEIFAVEVTAGYRFPDLVNHDSNLIGHSYVLSDEALGDVPRELRASS